MATNKPLCIYHANCIDGFASAFSLNFALAGEVDFCPKNYFDPPVQIVGKDRDVIMLDFSYKKKDIEILAKNSKSILIIDHHASAQRELVDLPKNVKTKFDMNKCGATLTWEVYCDDYDRPKIFDYIEDHDLGRWKLDGTRAIGMSLRSYPMELDVWADLLDDSKLPDMLYEGNILLRKHDRDIQNAVDTLTYNIEILNHTVPTINVPPAWATDVGKILSKGQPFSSSYYDLGKQRIFSLRSQKDGEDVSKIAEYFGGGGHKNAAGFTVDLEHIGDHYE